MATLNLQNLISQLSNNKNVKNLVGEFNKLTTEVKKLKDSGIKNISNELDAKSREKLSDLLSQYKQAVKTANSSQQILNHEVEKVLSKVKKSKGEIEKSIVTLKKQALLQASRLEKILKKSSTKKTTKKATKKVARKSTKKATKKA